MQRKTPLLMKYPLLILFLFCTGLLFGQEEYYVVQAKGTVRNKATGQGIKAGDRLKPADQLVFATRDDAVLVVSRSKGRFLLRPKQDRQTSLTAAVEAFVNDYLKLSKGHLSTRDVFSCNKDAFAGYLGKDPFMLIGDTAYVRNCRNLYDLSDNNFFFLQYQFPPGEFQTVKLEADASKIKIVKNSVFMVEGVPVNPEEVQCELGYGKEGQQPSRVSAFHPHFVPGPELKATLSNYLDHTGYSKLPEKQQIDSIMVVIRDYYGTPDNDELMAWLKKNLNLSSTGE